MKKIHVYNKKIVATILILTTLLVTSTSGFGALQQNNLEKYGYDETPQPMFYASISIYLYEGQSCACKPVPNESIIAEGITTDHSTSGSTDGDGLCILELEYDETYRFILDFEPFQKILLDVGIVDDQTFTFYMQEKEESSYQELDFISVHHTSTQLKN
ncbi:MAG: hypothetical protein R6V50_01460 [Thermoplasmatota archaeon]